MDVNFSVNRNSFIIGEHFCPQFSVTFVCPIISVKSAPKDSMTVLIYILLGYNTVFTILYRADRIVFFIIYINIVATDDIYNML